MNFIYIITYLISLLTSSFAVGECEKLETLIINQLNVKNGCKTVKTATFCSSLEVAFGKLTGNLNNTCIFLENEKEVLQNPYTFFSTSNFYIQFDKVSVEITCNKTNSPGISFYNSKNIGIYGKASIVMKGCGKQATIDIGGKKKIIRSTLLFHKVANLKVSKVFLRNYVGYGIIFQDVEQVQASHLALFNNSLSNITSTYGGGLLLIFTDLQSSPKANDVNILKFSSLNLHYLKTVNKGEISDNDEFSPFGNGGAISIYFNEAAMNNTIGFEDVLLKHNYGLFGGAVFVFDPVERNSINLKVITVDSNEARYDGGGIYFTSEGSSRTSSVSAILLWVSGNIKNNCAGVDGGGIALHRDHLSTRKYKWFVVNCDFANNTAMSGSDMFVGKAYVNTSDVVPRKFISSQTPTIGRVALVRSHWYLNGDISIMNSTGSAAIVMDHSSLYIEGKTSLYNNHGRHGGGISMYGLSKVTMVGDSCELLVEDNTSENEGSGIYARTVTSSVGVSTKYLQRSVCIFEFMDKQGYPIPHSSFKGSVRFSGNANNDIYVSTLFQCRKDKGKKPFVSWQNFNFSDANKTNHRAILTAPSSISFIRDEWTNLSPGVSSSQNITVLDANNESIDAIVDIIIRSTSESKKVTLEKKQYSVKSNQKISVAFIGETNTSFSLSFVSTDVDEILENVTLGNCPYFFNFNDAKNICECPKPRTLESKGRMKCHGGKIFFLDTLWTPEGLKDKPYVAFEHQKAYPCPNDYCKPCVQSECPYTANKQCSKYRTDDSRLCSECVEGTFLALAGNECIPCKNADNKVDTVFKWIGVLLVMQAINLLLFTTSIIFLNVALSGFTVPLVYFYIFGYYFLDEIRSEDKYFKSFLNVILFFREPRKYLFPGCFLRGLNNMTQTLFLLFQGINWLVSLKISYHVTNMISKREAFLRAVTTICFLSCQDLFEFVFRTLKPVTILETKYVYYYAAQEYGKYPHCIFVFLASIVIIAILYFLVAVILTTTWSTVKLYSKSKNSEIAKNVSQWLKEKSTSSLFIHLHVLTIGLQRGFKSTEERDRTWFSIAYFIFTGLFVGIYVLVEHEIRTLIMTICVLCFFLLLAIIKPHANDFNNFFELIVLGLLTTVGVLVDGINGAYDAQSEYLVTFNILMSIPAIVLIFRLLFFVIGSCAGKSLSVPLKAKWEGLIEKAEGKARPLIPFPKMYDSTTLIDQH